MAIMSSNSSAPSVAYYPDNDVIAIIKKDHKTVDGLFEKWQATSDADQLQHLAFEVIRELCIHSVAEEEVVYPMYVKKVPSTGGDIEKKSLEEHAELKNDLYKLDKLKPSDSDFVPTFQKIMNDVKTHVKEEETDFLVQFGQHTTQEERISLGKDFERIKAIAPTRPHPSVPTAAPPFTTMLAFATKPVDMIKDAVRFSGDKAKQEAPKEA
jgi:hemerythrin superfamily protein